MNVPYPGSDKSVGETIPDKVLVIGENLKIRRFAGTPSMFPCPISHGRPHGVLVNMTVEGIDDAQVTELGKDCVCRSLP